MAEGNSHFLDTHRATLVQAVNDVDTTLDILLGEKLITNEQYARIMSRQVTQQKMRELIDCTRGWDKSTKDELCQYLRTENRNVSIFQHWKPIQGDNEYKYGDVLNVECSGASKAAAIRNCPAGESEYKYGDVLNVECSGASKATAIRNCLAGETGVEASYAIAKRDADAIRALKDKIVRVAKSKGVDPSLIAGLISRSSNAGTLLHNGWGQSNCFGLMQISKWHEIRGDWDSEEHIGQGTEILVDMIGFIKGKFPEWSPAQLLKGGTAAYMCGQSNVHSYDVDQLTDCKDFSNDVMARAHWYKKHVFQAV